MTATETGLLLDDHDLSEAERGALEAIARGDAADLRTGQADADDPERGSTWGADRTVRADLLIDLLTGRRVPEGPPLRGVGLIGVRITGSLDLAGTTAVCPLLLWNCWFDEPMDLARATIPLIRMPGCHVPALTATQLKTDGNVELALGFTAHGEVDMDGARIGGKLIFDGARLANPGGTALNAQLIRVEQGMSCEEGFSADGEVRVAGAHIGGQLVLSDATFTNPGGLALNADSLHVDQGMYFQDGFRATGEIRLAGARIGGYLDLSGTLTNEAGNGAALNAQRLVVGQTLHCWEGFTVRGRIDLTGARIAGSLDLGDASLTASGEQERALDAQGMVIEGNLRCDAGFTAHGEISLNGAQIGGYLSLTGAHLVNPDGIALNAELLHAAQGIYARAGLVVEGEFRLVAARVGRQLALSGAELTNPGGWALAAYGLHVDGNMLCRDGFTAKGGIRLLGAHIGGELVFEGARLANPGDMALQLEGARAAVLYLLFAEPPDGVVDLTNAKVGAFFDDPASWPATLGLRGFTYDTLENDGVSVRDRLTWLAREYGGDYVPQLYDQLAAAYRRAGREEAARKVAIAKQWRRRRVLNPAGRLANWLLYITVGYGYRSWLAGAWLLVLVAVGSIVFSAAYPADMVATGSRPPAFHAVAYTLDVLLPIVDLDQQKSWRPQGAAMYWSWGLVAAGWILTTAVVAALTGILKRD
jgi:hypothetical protein